MSQKRSSKVSTESSSHAEDRVSKVGWYTAGVLSRFDYYDDDLDDPDRLCNAEECLYLLRADDPDEAYEEALSWGKASGGTECIDLEDGRKGRWRFIGIVDLQPVKDEVRHGCGVYSIALSFSAAYLETRVASKREDLWMFDPAEAASENYAKARVSESGWYLAVLELRFDHYGDDLANPDRECDAVESLRLIRADTPEEAYAEAIELGKTLDGTEGMHWGNRRKGQWRYVGIAELLPVYDELEDGCKILCTDMEFSAADLDDRVAARKEDLWIFKPMENEKGDESEQRDELN